VTAAPKPAATIADATRLYVDERASLREGLQQGLINFAALARKIQSETGLKNEEAVTIALRRYQAELEREAPRLSRARAIVSESRLEVHPRVAIVRMRDDFETLDRLLALGRRTLSTPAKRRVVELFLGTQAVTILCEESFLSTILPEIPAALRIRVERGLGTLAFRSRPEVAETPGVLAYMVDALYRAGINCMEIVSVHTDSIFVFRDQDLMKAYQALAGLVPPGQAEPGPGLERVA
jgi:hypothetical protein